MLPLLTLAGVALFAALIIRHGAGDIAAAVLSAGWGLAVVIAVHAGVLATDAAAWRVLFSAEDRPRLSRLLRLRWIGESINGLLPVSHVGGDLVRGRLLARGGMRWQRAAASVMADITVGVFTQIIFTISGVLLLIHVVGKNGLSRDVLAGSLVAIAAVGGFYTVQQIGIFKIAARLGGGTFAAAGENLDQELAAIYSRPAGLAASCAWTFCSWALGAMEVCIALRALAAPAGFARSWMIESIAQGARAAAFFVPGALGIQEEGYLLIGVLLGLSPTTALALAVIRRVRELAVGVPGLLLWTWKGGQSTAGPRLASKAS